MNIHFALARQAMCAGFRILGARPGDRIAVPAFICSDVPAALVHDGYQLDYYDIQQSLQPDLSQPKPQADFLLVVNYFGFPADVASVTQRWGFDLRQIIEDNAHGLFSRDQEGRVLGQRTALGFTSFRKSLRVGDGGTLHVNSPLLVELAAAEQLEPISRAPSVGGRLRQFGAQLSEQTRLPLMNLLRTTKRAVVRGAVQPFDETTRYPSPASSQSLAVLHSCNPVEECRRRVSIYQRILPQIVAAGGQPIFRTLPSGVAPYALPFFSTTHVAQRVQRDLWLRNFEVFPWPNLPQIDRDYPSWYQHVHLVSFLR